MSGQFLKSSLGDSLHTKDVSASSYNPAHTKNRLISQLCMALIIAPLLLSGCATVKVSMPGIAIPQTVTKAAPVSERVVLVSSVSELSNTPWPQPEEKTMQARMTAIMFGGAKNTPEVMTKTKAREIYLHSVRATAVPARAVLSDSDKCLARARNVAEAGRQAVSSIKAEREDILVLEKAITSVRETRDMYVSVLKVLHSDDARQISKSDIKEIKAAFTQTMLDIGRTADVLADRVAAEKLNLQYASPISDTLE